MSEFTHSRCEEKKKKRDHDLLDSTALPSVTTYVYCKVRAWKDITEIAEGDFPVLSAGRNIVIIRRERNGPNYASKLNNSPKLIMCRGVPKRQGVVHRNNHELLVARQGDRGGISCIENEPFTEQGPRGHIETLDFAKRDGEELMTIGCPSERRQWACLY